MLSIEIIADVLWWAIVLKNSKRAKRLFGYLWTKIITVKFCLKPNKFVISYSYELYLYSNAQLESETSISSKYI